MQHLEVKDMQPVGGYGLKNITQLHKDYNDKKILPEAFKSHVDKIFKEYLQSKARDRSLIVDVREVTPVPESSALDAILIEFHKINNTSEDTKYEMYLQLAEVQDPMGMFRLAQHCNWQAKNSEETWRTYEWEKFAIYFFQRSRKYLPSHEAQIAETELGKIAKLYKNPLREFNVSASGIVSVLRSRLSPLTIDENLPLASYAASLLGVEEYYKCYVALLKTSGINAGQFYDAVKLLANFSHS